MKIFVIVSITVVLGIAAGVLGCTPAPTPRAEVQAAPPAPNPDAASAARTPAVPKDSPHYDLFEGTSRNNSCGVDDDCHVGGCSHEVCSADTRVMTPCIAHDDAPRDATCGCVSGQCVWYH